MRNDWHWRKGKEVERKWDEVGRNRSRLTWIPRVKRMRERERACGPGGCGGSTIPAIDMNIAWVLLLGGGGTTAVWQLLAETCPSWDGAVRRTALRV